ncbi:hypothetical protein LC612_12980 [Nostoc sp. CHAB 5834]|nr:hypothetical protein [Nostoc sp. CHAB 5834]
MSETPQDDRIWIVTDDTPQISIPEGAKGASTNTRGWGDETRDTTGSKGVGTRTRIVSSMLVFAWLRWLWREYSPKSELFIERTSGSPDLNQRGRRQPPNIKPSRIAW